jgi:hypothetical protein
MQFFQQTVCDQVDWTKEPIRHLRRSQQLNTFHIFDYPGWMDCKARVEYFRSASLGLMTEHHTSAMLTQQFTNRLHNTFSYITYNNILTQQLRTHRTVNQLFLMLDVSREKALEDTLNLLRGQPRSVLLKPLKAKMGSSEGEMGEDQGGITAGFFREVIKQAFQPCSGESVSV